jgi:predicted transcriptional regulator
MLTKEKIQKAVEQFPEEISLDDMIDRLILLDKVEQGLNDVESGNIYTTEEVENRLQKWLK